jgi:SLT domain-containing protein
LRGRLESLASVTTDEETEETTITPTWVHKWAEMSAAADQEDPNTLSADEDPNTTTNDADLKSAQLPATSSQIYQQSDFNKKQNTNSNSDAGSHIVENGEHEQPLITLDGGDCRAAHIPGPIHGFSREFALRTSSYLLK